MFKFLREAPDACGSCLIACPRVIELDARYSQHEDRKNAYKKALQSNAPVDEIVNLYGDGVSTLHLPAREILGEQAWQIAAAPYLELAGLAINNIDSMQAALAEELRTTTGTCDQSLNCG